ncbi:MULTISPECIES: HIT family protein [Fictibacillus]|uniref:HIT family protein n=1 Tax=Fictibacillus TaxID=1329200 RepID=UPI001012DD73|nr:MULTISPECIES: HIT family protein [Fictibacillus]MDM5197700.1 HIT family protein [Fictibacillus enclensis]RXZ00284.1 HIT family protein [Fictibacillus sp. S7]WHY73279.1 HIT family protein [Fictibacillus enclensis]
MNHDDQCIFCKIVKGEIPAYKVYEDENVVAFLDISQVTKGHTLVIPKSHHKDVFALPSETAGKLFSAVPQIATAIKEAFDPIGLNVLNNNGEAAGQSVFHYHVHIIPRYGKGDGFGAVWETHDYTKEQFEEISNNIASRLS